MASPLLLADACSDPVLLGGLILLIITCLFLIALRAVRLHAAHQLNKKTLVQPGPWSLVCMVLHLVSGLYMTEGYFRLCSNPGSTQSGIFKLLPSFLVLRLGTSANFYFMWLLRAKLTEYQQFRSCIHKALMVVYRIVCSLHFLSSVAMASISWSSASSYSETCDGEWLYIPLGSESVYNQTCDESTCANEILQKLVEFLSGLALLFELIATFSMLILFGGPLKEARYQRHLSQVDSVSTIVINNHESPDNPDLSEQLQIAQSEIQRITQEWQAQAARAQVLVQAQAAGAHIDSEAQQQTLKVLYFNLVAACIAQLYDVTATSYLIYCIVTTQRIRHQYFEVVHFLNTFFFVAYYSIVFRDHKWLADKFSQRQEVRVVPEPAGS